MTIAKGFTRFFAVSERQREVILDALSMAQRQCTHLADQAEDRAIRAATRAVAQEYGDLLRQLKDGMLDALLTQGLSPGVMVRTRDVRPEATTQDEAAMRRQS
jgi:hypothetical protein